MKTNKLTSVQISTQHRDMLKKYCDEWGFNMSKFTEKLIEEKINPTTNKNCFSGEGRPVNGSTPFGLYDNEESFRQDCYSAMLWAARRLGYPIIDIELLDINFYASFEESVSTYNSMKKGKLNYTDIETNGKEWIRKYFLAICKDVIGSIRQKYQEIPTPGGFVKLNGTELKEESKAEKKSLLEDI